MPTYRPKLTPSLFERNVFLLETLRDICQKNPKLMKWTKYDNNVIEKIKLFQNEIVKEYIKEYEK